MIRQRKVSAVQVVKRKTVHIGNGPSPHQVQPMDTRNDDPLPSTTVGSEVQYHQSGRCLTAPSQQPAQYQQIGEGQLSHITDDPVTRADDVDVTSNPAAPRPDAHDIATPRHAHRHAMPRHATPTDWRQMPHMGRQHPDPVPVQQAQVRLMHNVWSAVRARRTSPAAAGQPQYAASLRARPVHHRGYRSGP